MRRWAGALGIALSLAAARCASRPASSSAPPPPPPTPVSRFASLAEAEPAVLSLEDRRAFDAAVLGAAAAVGHPVGAGVLAVGPPDAEGHAAGDDRAERGRGDGEVARHEVAQGERRRAAQAEREAEAAAHHQWQAETAAFLNRWRQLPEDEQRRLRDRAIAQHPHTSNAFAELARRCPLAEPLSLLLPLLAEML